MRYLAMSYDAIDRITKHWSDEVKRLVDENAKLRAEKIQMATVNNSLILAIVSTIPFKGEIGGSNICVKDQLYKLIDSFYALQEIKRIINACKNSRLCNSECKYWDECDGHCNTVILNKIDEVLGNEI